MSQIKNKLQLTLNSKNAIKDILSKKTFYGTYSDGSVMDDTVEFKDYANKIDELLPNQANEVVYQDNTNRLYKDVVSGNTVIANDGSAGGLSPMSPSDEQVIDFDVEGYAYIRDKSDFAGGGTELTENGQYQIYSSNGGLETGTAYSNKALAFNLFENRWYDYSMSSDSYLLYNENHNIYASADYYDGDVIYKNSDGYFQITNIANSGTILGWSKGTLPDDVKSIRPIYLDSNTAAVYSGNSIVKVDKSSLGTTMPNSIITSLPNGKTTIVFDKALSGSFIISASKDNSPMSYSEMNNYIAYTASSSSISESNTPTDKLGEVGNYSASGATSELIAKYIQFSNSTQSLTISVTIL